MLRNLLTRSRNASLPPTLRSAAVATVMSPSRWQSPKRLLRCDELILTLFLITVDVVAGGMLVKFEAERPASFYFVSAETIGRVGYRDKFRKLPVPTELYGGNTVVRRRVFARIGRFRPDLGLAATGVAEDTEFSGRVPKAEYAIFYAPQVLIRHQLSPFTILEAGSKLGREYSRRKAKPCS